eukprot:14746836-Alexandrium_andersonii.AAC.1
MNYNILQAERTRHRRSLQHPCAIAVFFGFKAAFPSVSRDFMWVALKWIGLPEKWTTLLMKI